MESHVSDISRVIQLAVAPVFLLTAIATMINAMNTRLGRIVDRRRKVIECLNDPDSVHVAEAKEELRSLYRRIRLAYTGILFSVLSGLLVCLVIAGAFIGALISVDLARVVAVTFVLAMFAMVVSLGMFLREIYVAVSSGSHIIH